MVTSAIKSTIQQAYRQYLQGRQIKPRSGQREMIAEIARYLSAINIDGDYKRQSEPAVCVIEAGTGTGKTLAYLMASLPFANALRKNIVVSTATVTLQQQIIDQELPLLKAHTDLEFTVALAKGRRRYLCLHKVDLNLQDQPQTSLKFADTEVDSAAGEVADGSEHQYSAEAYQQFLNWMFDDGWQGDFDHLPEPVDSQLWDQVSTDHRQCLNKRCGFLSQCPYFLNKARIDQAELVVANHDLVFADLSLGGGFVLPPPEQTIYIFDEGHHLSSKALGHFSCNAGVKGAQKLLKGISKLLADGQLTWASDPAIASKLQPLSSLSIECHQHFDALYSYLKEHTDWQVERVRDRDQPGLSFRFPMGVLPTDLQHMAQQCAERTQAMSTDFDAVVKRVRELIDKERQGATARQALEQALLQLSGYQSQIENLDAVWQLMQQPSQQGRVPVARWLSVSGDEQEADVVVHASPTNVADLLGQRLWERAFGVVMTSATMSVAGSFERLISQNGLPADSTYSIHTSPFNFAENCTLQLFDVGIEPSDREEYLQRLAAGVDQLVAANEATLVLFSSKRHMNYVAEALENAYPTGFMKVQGSNNKTQLLFDHRQSIEDGKGSLIFGLASFAEGLDLPGHYLTHVVIAKLPFSVPDDPVEATYGEWLKARGGNPFHQVMVPDATTRLLQACGRLLRSEQDKGRITICDRRLWKKSYGHLILNALPPYRRQWLQIESIESGGE